jgi:hypothetical protein
LKRSGFALKGAALLALAAVAPAMVSATGVWKVPCDILQGVWDAVKVIGPSLVMIMLIYGSAKYAYSADDPGGRKLGRDIMVHAIVGGLIMGLVVTILTSVGGLNAYLCVTV